MTGEMDVNAELVALLPRLRRFAVALTGSREDGDDLVQEAVTRALSRIDRWQPGTHLDRWLLRIARNLWFDRLRSARSHGPLLSLTGMEQLASEDGEKKVQDALMLKEAIHAMSRLPDEQREVLALVVIDGRPYREAAAILDVPVGTVMSRLARARKAVSTAVHGGGLGTESGSTGAA